MSDPTSSGDFIGLSSSRLKGLPPGICLSVVFDRERGVVHATTLYSPGIHDRAGRLRQWIRWTFAAIICARGHRIYVAFALSIPRQGESAHIELMALCGGSELYATELGHILQGIGLSHSEELIQHAALRKLEHRIHSVQHQISEFTCRSNFLGPAKAARFEQARKKLFPR